MRSRFSFHHLAAVLVAVLAFAFSPAVSHAQAWPGEIQTTGILLRAAEELTNEEEATTTFSLSETKPVAVIYYVDFTTGSLTSATFTPTGNLDTADTANAYKVTNYSKTFTETGKYTWRVPREEFGSGIGGMVCTGAGTVTGSSATVYYRFER